MNFPHRAGISVQIAPAPAPAPTTTTAIFICVFFLDLYVEKLDWIPDVFLTTFMNKHDFK